MLLTFLVSFLLSWPCHAEFQVPGMMDGVTDDADILSPGLRGALSEALKAIHAKGGPQVAVLTMSTIGDMPIENATMKVAREWKLGTENKDNGVLLFVAKKERGVRIEVGQGVEGDLTDAVSGRIIDQIIIPTFRQGDFDTGILLGVDAILKRMNPPVHLEDYLNTPAPRRGSSKEFSWLHLFIFIAFLIALSISRGGGGRGRRRAFATGAMLGGLGGGGFGGGFGSRGGGGGGWSGGGGGFSGGGASGSW